MNLIFFPSPKIQKPSTWITSLPVRRLVHPHDAWAPFVELSYSPLAKYKPSIILTHTTSDSRITRMTILDNKLILNVSSSLKPIPPCCFTLVIVSHRDQCIFLFEFDPPYQKIAIKAFISERQVFEIFMTLMAYKGMTVITAFRSTSYPPLFRICALIPTLEFIHYVCFQVTEIFFLRYLQCGG